MRRPLCFVNRQRPPCLPVSVSVSVGGGRGDTILDVFDIPIQTTPPSPVQRPSTCHGSQRMASPRGGGREQQQQHRPRSSHTPREDVVRRPTHDHVRGRNTRVSERKEGRKKEGSMRVACMRTCSWGRKTRIGKHERSKPHAKTQPTRVTQNTRHERIQTRATNEEAGNNKADEKEGEETGEEVLAGQVSRWLEGRGLPNKGLGFDHQGVEILDVKAQDLIPVCLALNAYGFNYLRNQCGYDSEPGGDLVSVYHLVKMDPDMDQNDSFPEEVCIKVFLPREDPRVPSVFWIWKTADFQERETYDMYGIIYEGHPDLKRLLMPENWEGWPLRKDYITPDFYELQDAY